MILHEIVPGSDGSAWYSFFHERRTALVRYIDGKRQVQIRTEGEAQKAAYLALATSADETVAVP